MAKVNKTPTTKVNNSWKNMREESPDRIVDVTFGVLTDMYGNDKDFIFGGHNFLGFNDIGIHKIFIDAATNNTTIVEPFQSRNFGTQKMRENQNLGFFTGDKIEKIDKYRAKVISIEQPSLSALNNGGRLHLINQMASTSPSEMLNKYNIVESLLYANTQDFYTFMNRTQTSYSFVDPVKGDKDIKGLKIRTNAGLLMHKIRGKIWTSENSDEEFDLDLKLVDNGRKPVYIPFRPVSVENGKVQVMTHWLDYNQTLPLNEAVLFNTAYSIKDYFNDNLASEMVIGIIKMTHAYSTNFVDYRFTSDGANHITGEIDGTRTIAGYSVGGLMNTELNVACDNIYHSFMAKNPNIRTDKVKVAKINRFISAISKFAGGGYSVGAGMDYVKAYLPWTLEPTGEINSGSTIDLQFTLTSEFFIFNGTTVDAIPLEEIDIANSRVFNLDRSFSEPLLGEIIETSNRIPLPGQLNKETNEGLKYLFLVNFKNTQAINDFFVAVENSKTETQTIIQTYPDTDWMMYGPNADWDRFFPNQHANLYIDSPYATTGINRNVYPVLTYQGILFKPGNAVESIGDIERQVMIDVGLNPDIPPNGWTFNATAVRDTSRTFYWLNDFPSKEDWKHDGQRGNLIRWSNIRYSYEKIITNSGIKQRTSVFDKRKIEELLVPYVDNFCDWNLDFELTSAKGRQINELVIKHLYGENIQIDIIYTDGSKTIMPKINTSSRRNQEIGETKISF